VSNPPGPNASAGQRLIWAVETLWQGNRSAAARDLKISHGLLWAIAAGKRSPGRRVVTAIAADGRINVDWVSSGVGQPLLSKSETLNPCTVPVALRLLPGPPKENAGALSTSLREVAASDFAASRYCCLLGDDLRPELYQDGLRAGDVLLLDADSALWFRNSDFLRDRWCAVRVRTDALTRIELAKLGRQIDGRIALATDIRPRTPAIRSRRIDLDDELKDPPKRIAEPDSIEIDDVVGVVVKLTREFL